MIGGEAIRMLDLREEPSACHDRRVKIIVVTMAVSLSLLLLSPRVAGACASAPPPGQEVVIADEEALIVWDPTTKTEQFIRRARFDSTAQSFGFLVPTPATPALDEVDASVFSALAVRIRPRIEVDRSGVRFELGALLWETCGMTLKSAPDGIDTSSPSKGVEVIQSVAVAGFRATTLAASDPAAISAWLGEHGFAQTPQLTAWLARYVEDAWVITAFVIEKPAKDAVPSREVATTAVRMTFQTETPFYPYREPAPIEMTTPPRVPTAGRMLRVFFLAKGMTPSAPSPSPSVRYAATVGKTMPWTARVLHAGLVRGVANEVPDGYLTVFVDESNPRLAIDELYFAPTPAGDISQTRTVRNPRRILLPLDVLILGAALVGWRWRRRGRGG
jgi:hypothetical protein